MLHLPNFNNPFTIDCDASRSGFRVVLHQGEGTIAFFSCPFAPQHLKLAAYEHELIGLVQAIRHWRPYLWGRRFVVHTNHYALKFMLDQRLSTITQHHWVSKLFGFDFTVEYRSGRLNTVADVLSFRMEGDSHLGALSAPSYTLFDDLRRELRDDAGLRALRDSIVADHGTPWCVADGLILHGDRIYIPASLAALLKAL